MREGFLIKAWRGSLGGTIQGTGSLMNRAFLALLCGSLLGGCSDGGVTEVAENIRIQAEGAGARSSFRRESSRSSQISQVSDGVQSYTVPQGAQAAPEPKKAPVPEKKPQPVYVVVPY